MLENKCDGLSNFGIFLVKTKLSQNYVVNHRMPSYTKSTDMQCCTTYGTLQVSLSLVYSA